MKKTVECPFPKVFPSQLEKGNLFFMQLAYNEAINAWNDDEVPVGAVIARGEEVIASAFNQTRRQKGSECSRGNDRHNDGRQIRGRLEAQRMQAVRYQGTLPHVLRGNDHGETGRSAFRRQRPEDGLLGRGHRPSFASFSNHRPKIESGTMELECKEMLQAFFQMQRK